VLCRVFYCIEKQNPSFHLQGSLLQVVARQHFGRGDSYCIVFFTSVPRSDFLLY
jgi:hypothetical protein